LRIGIDRLAPNTPHRQRFEQHGWTANVLLVISAFGIPLIAFKLYSKNVKLVEAANRMLEKQISEARWAKLEAKK
jgi:NAD(P)H-dependent flavin oxidoreductase YrpB (nitropropane dioxygenase family)